MGSKFYKLELKSGEKVKDTYFAVTDKSGNVTDVLNFPTLLVSDEKYLSTARENSDIAYGWAVDGIDGIKEWMKSDENGGLKGKIETTEIGYDDWHKVKFKWYKNEKMAELFLSEKGFHRAWQMRAEKSPSYKDISKQDIRELRLARIEWLTELHNNRNSIKIDKDEMKMAMTQKMLKDKYTH